MKMQMAGIGCQVSGARVGFVSICVHSWLVQFPASGLGSFVPWLFKTLLRPGINPRNPRNPWLKNCAKLRLIAPNYGKLRLKNL
jgi:hypothetical protein